jgi:hypothetical protein
MSFVASIEKHFATCPMMSSIASEKHFVTCPMCLYVSGERNVRLDFFIVSRCIYSL